jgi:NAD(P)-dependent dehydrogenase (short-subunit alcohol dehydrogenase family)
MPATPPASSREPRVLLQDKVIAISGVGPGLGAELARVCLADGAQVALGARTEERLEALAAELDPAGDRVFVEGFDIRSETDRARFVDGTVARFGRIDGVVQVAARQGLIGGFLEIDEESWRESYDGNLVAPLQLVRLVALRMRDSGGGSIVLVGSQSARVTTGPTIVYGASKGALVPAMYYMTEELGPFGIRVNVVEPTWVWGHRVQAIMRQRAEDNGTTEQEEVDRQVATWPLRRMPEERDVADAIAFLLSDRSRSITGQLLRVNAGQFMG